MRVTALWGRAPGRAWRRGGAGGLLLLAVLAAAASAASAPMFVQQAGDDALRTVRAGIPDTAITAESDDVRIVSGTAPDSEDQQFDADSLRLVPGLSEPTTVAFSVAPELRYASFVRPEVRHGQAAVRARLAAVDDPATALVRTGSRPVRTRGVWLPDPIARRLAVSAGDTVELVVLTRDATHPAPPEAPPDPVVRVPVEGTYAVAADGRRPADPPQSARWSRRIGGLPSDTEYSTLASFLVVADVATAESIAARTGDELMWTVESGMRPGLTLTEAQATSAGIAALRETVIAPTTERPGPLRTGLVSGIEDVVATAVALREATRERTVLLAAAGTVTGLLAALAVAVLLASDRRAELRHGAGIGVGPFRTAGLWAWESLLPACLGAVGGVLLARGALELLGPDVGVDPGSSGEAFRAAAAVSVVAVLLVAVVAGVAVLMADRPRPDGRRRGVPWVWITAAVGLTALAATATSRTSAPGAVAVLTPTLVAVSCGAVLARGAGAVARRWGAASLPDSPAAGARWLGWRRTAATGASGVLAVAAVALGLGLLLVTATAVSATRTAIADRAAVRAGAEATARIPGTWAFLARPPRAPTVAELADGARVPIPADVPAPQDSTFVWRVIVSVGGDDGSRDLLAVDPTRFAAVASWGEGTQLGDTRGLLAWLASAADAQRSDPSADVVPVIAVGDAAVRAGQEVTVSGQEWQAPVHVLATVDAFPGLGERPLLVAPARVLLPYLGRADPRLAPPTDQSARAYSETWLWSSGPVAGLVSRLASAGVEVQASTSAAELAVDPLLDAAGRSVGYLVALAIFVAITALVVLAEQSRREARRNRAADAMLVRVGMGARGVRAARRWHVAWSVAIGLLAALVATALLLPLGAGLFDLDRTARPAFEFRLGWAGIAVTLAVAGCAYVVASSAASRGSRGSGSDEAVLRDG